MNAQPETTAEFCKRATDADLAEEIRHVQWCIAQEAAAKKGWVRCALDRSLRALRKEQRRREREKVTQ